MAKKPRSPGQPTKYDSKYCDMIEDYLANGGIMEAFGATIGVHRETVFEWRKKHPEFSEACKKGRSLSLEHWRKVGYEAMMGENPKFNVVIWIFFMKNIHGWKDKVEFQESEDIEDMEFVG